MSVMLSLKFNEVSIISNGPSTVHIYSSGHKEAKAGVDFHPGFPWEFLLHFEVPAEQGWQTWAPEHLCRLQIPFLQLPIPVCVQKPGKALRIVVLVLSASAARWTEPVKSALPGAGPLCGQRDDQEKSSIAGF